MVVSMFFYFVWSESSKHSDISSPVQKYILDGTFDTPFALVDMQATYREPVHRIALFDYSKIGAHEAIGNNLRVTYRLFNVQKNTDPTTMDIFKTEMSLN